MFKSLFMKPYVYMYNLLYMQLVFVSVYACNLTYKHPSINVRLTVNQVTLLLLVIPTQLLTSLFVQQACWCYTQIHRYDRRSCVSECVNYFIDYRRFLSYQKQMWLKHPNKPTVGYNSFYFIRKKYGQRAESPIN